MSAAAQLWRTAQDLCPSVINKHELDVTTRQRLQTTLEKLFVADLDYALEKHADTLLWNNCHKQCIDLLQNNLRKKRTDQDAALYTMLLSASFGSLHQLLVTVTSVYDVDFTGVNADWALGATVSPSAGQSKKRISDQSSRRFVQFCLIHLGDLCRYQKQLDSAESFYSHALRFDPSDGHAWNQMGILATSRADQLGSTYFYVRGLSVSTPFDPAAANIDKLYAHLTISSLDSLDCSKDYTGAFLSFHAYCHQFLRLKSIEKTLQDLMEVWPGALSGLSPTEVLRMFCLNAAAVHKLGLGRDEIIVAEMIRRLISGQMIGLFNYCSQLESSELAKWMFAIAVMVKWCEQNQPAAFADPKAALRAACTVVGSIRKLIDVDLTSSFDYGSRVDFTAFLPFRDITMPEENDALDALQCCRHLVTRLVKQFDASVDDAWLTSVDDSQLWTVMRRLLYGDHLLDDVDISTSKEADETTGHRASSLPPTHTTQRSPEDTLSETARSTPSPRRRLTKCVPLLKLMEQRRSIEGDKEKEKESPDASAARGLLKIKLPDTTTTDAKKANEKLDDVSSEKDKADGLPSVKLDRPPRFTAQKLKQALTGASVSAPSSHPPSHLPISFPPPLPPAPWTSSTYHAPSPTNVTTPTPDADYANYRPFSMAPCPPTFNAGGGGFSQQMNFSLPPPPIPFPLGVDRSFDPWTSGPTANSEWPSSIGLGSSAPGTNANAFPPPPPQQMPSTRFPPPPPGSQMRQPPPPNRFGPPPTAYSRWSNANQ